MQKQTISVVTPTFFRPEETIEMLENLSKQKLLPDEVVLVDGAPPEENRTEEAVKKVLHSFPFAINYIREGGGTAIQRNFGIDAAKSDFIAFVDDDVRLDSDFLFKMVEIFNNDTQKKVGGIVGYRKNKYFYTEESQRWRWYKKLNLLTTYEPGRYDFKSGYPINTSMQKPFEGTRQVDFMTTACAVWRREVFDSGLRFHPFFIDYGVLEDAHLSLLAKRKWDLLQCGDALCEEMSSPNGRVNRRKIGYKCVVNYYFVFKDIASPLSLSQKFRFWRFQMFEFFRIGSSAVRRKKWDNIQEVIGKIEGVIAIMRGISDVKK
ncbi:MAG: glycosyltransferase [Acidobacteriota bacterium]